MSADPTICVIGGGAWGTALACAALRAGRRTALVVRGAAQAESIRSSGENAKLPGVALDPALIVTDQRPQADIVLLAVPAQALRAAAETLAASLAPGTPVVACAKGIEQTSNAFMSEVIAQALPQAVPAILSGPSFASDVARGLPTAVTLACADETIAVELVHALGSATFRPYHTSDLRGVEIGGAAKNVLAIAAGIVAGRDLGASALAALTTRAFAELQRFGIACGARRETLGGLSGLGDLVLSCASAQSRNFALGVALGRGDALPPSLAEGRWTAPVLHAMAQKRDVEMPIVGAVTAILEGALSVDEAIEALLARPFKAEE